MPQRLCRLLHRALNLVGDSGPAGRQAGRGTLPAIDTRQALPDLRPARTSGGLHQPAPLPGNVRNQRRRSAAEAGRVGTGNAAGADGLTLK